MSFFPIVILVKMPCNNSYTLLVDMIWNFNSIQYFSLTLYLHFLFTIFLKELWFVFMILQDTGNNIWILLEIEYRTNIGWNIYLANRLAGKSLYFFFSCATFQVQQCEGSFIIMFNWIFTNKKKKKTNRRKQIKLYILNICSSLSQIASVLLYPISSVV